MPITVLPTQGGFFDAASQSFNESSKRAQEILLQERELDLEERRVTVGEKTAALQAETAGQEQAQREAILGIQQAQQAEVERQGEAQRALGRRAGLANTATARLRNQEFDLAKQLAPLQIELAELEIDDRKARLKQIEEASDQPGPLDLLAIESSKTDIGFAQEMMAATGGTEEQVLQNFFNVENRSALFQLNRSILGTIFEGEEVDQASLDVAARTSRARAIAREAGVNFGEIIAKMEEFKDDPAGLANALQTSETLAGDKEALEATIRTLVTLDPSTALAVTQFSLEEKIKDSPLIKSSLGGIAAVPILGTPAALFILSQSFEEGKSFLENVFGPKVQVGSN